MTTIKTSPSMKFTTPTDRELVIERTFNAPRKLVFDAFTKAEHLTQWWGPTGWTLPVCKIDFRVGGVWHYCMRGPKGEESWGKAVYREIVEPERIVYVDSFADKDGNAVPGFPEMLITNQFTERRGKTTLTSTTLFPSAEARDSIIKMGVAEGITQTWDRLEQHLTQLQAAKPAKSPARKPMPKA